jgi:hypothetical protein
MIYKVVRGDKKQRSSFYCFAGNPLLSVQSNFLYLQSSSIRAPTKVGLLVVYNEI